jgi:hypothetical protein
MSKRVHIMVRILTDAAYSYLEMLQVQLVPNILSTLLFQNLRVPQVHYMPNLHI